jgi:hypothetical protein
MLMCMLKHINWIELSSKLFVEPSILNNQTRLF